MLDDDLLEVASWCLLAISLLLPIYSVKILLDAKKDQERMIARFPGEGLMTLLHVLLQENVNQRIP